MIHCRLGSRPRILTVPFATALGSRAVLRGNTAAKGQPRRRSPLEALRGRADPAAPERDQIRAEVTKLARLASWRGADIGRKELAVTREVRGELHEDVVDRFKPRAGCKKRTRTGRRPESPQGSARDPPAAAGPEGLADRRRPSGFGRPRSAGGADRPAQRQRLAEADRLKPAPGTACTIRGSMRRESHRPQGYGDPGGIAGREPPRLCHQPEQPGRAVPGTWGTTRRPSRSSAKPWRSQAQALGENHPDYATSLNNLASCTRPWAITRRPSRSSAKPWRSEAGAGREPPRRMPPA